MIKDKDKFRDATLIIDFIKQEYNIDLSVYNSEFLLNIIHKRVVKNEMEGFEDYYPFLKINRTEAEAFIDSLNVSYSDFFREPLTFGLLEQIILPEMIARKVQGSEIRVWSAGCANGKEAYSIAILLSELIEVAQKEMTYRIFATDISAKALAEGAEGIFDETSMQGLKSKYIKKYFIAGSKGYAAKEKIKKCVIFSAYNMLDTLTENPPESIYGDFDLVICSNLLIYYNASNQRIIIHKLEKALSNKGVLVTGESEKALIKNISSLKMLAPENGVFQVNKGGRSD